MWRRRARFFFYRNRLKLRGEFAGLDFAELLQLDVKRIPLIRPARKDVVTKGQWLQSTVSIYVTTPSLYTASIFPILWRKASAMHLQKSLKKICPFELEYSQSKIALYSFKLAWHSRLPRGVQYNTTFWMAINVLLQQIDFASQMIWGNLYVQTANLFTNLIWGVLADPPRSQPGFPNQQELPPDPNKFFYFFQQCRCKFVYGLVLGVR